MSVHKILGSAIVSAAICAAGASTVIWINNPAKATTAIGNSNHSTLSTDTQWLFWCPIPTDYYRWCQTPS
ncbi:hypothetical protein ACE1CI_23300 [Aerosakkonemataceae cyanobacterium BLCC-F50]|uniref:Uncharacterized protein n=1 Tax=Floridaenema flaviceps BLCC-F50 TaxID=3153642 RepID=A0ABV4XW05_9CYAN